MVRYAGSHSYGQHGEGARKLRKLKAIYFAPLLAVIALFAWALASPMGAAPDDDYHLVSTWCAQLDSTHCEVGDSASTRTAPEAILHSACYAAAPEQSAACQKDYDLTGDVKELTKRGNFVGAYPPLYYSVMHAFVGGDILASVVIMRLVNVLLFVGLTSVLFWLLPIPRRQTLILMWTITTVPMGMFLLASNNPSGWAITGVGTVWLAVLGYLESFGWRKWVLGALAIVGTLMAAGSRGDAAMYTILGIGAVFILTFPRVKKHWRSYGLDAILPVALVGICLAFFALSGQTQSGMSGFSGSSDAGDAPVDAPVTAQGLEGFGRFAYNLLNIPFLWAGNFGEWGLGWLDTSMPTIVSLGAISCLVAIGFTGLGRMWGRKLFVVLGAGIVLWALPLYVLTKGGQIVGESVQPRYVLPLMVLLAGLVLVTRNKSVLSFTRAQVVLIVGTLAAINLVALQINMRRYITGIDMSGVNLDAGIEWWWPGMPSPMFVWIIGSAAYAALLFIIVKQVAWPRVVADAASGGAASGGAESSSEIQTAPIAR